jgi:subtilase family serine protease
VRTLSARAAVTAAAAFPLVLTGIAVAPAHAANGRAVVRGAVPRWATSSADRGPAANGHQLTARVYLAPRHADRLADRVQAVSDPSSPSYGDFITPSQYRATYAPTRSQVRSVKTWLRNAGLKVTSANRHYVAVRGTVAHAEQAFGTQLHMFTRHGSLLRAPTSQTTVPRALSSTVLAITGLDSARHMVTPATQKPFPPEGVFKNAQPCSTFYGEKTTANSTPPSATYAGPTYAYAPCGYTPPQLRGAYGAAGSGLTGEGVTVAITDAFASGTIEADAQKYAETNDPSNQWADGQLQQLPPDLPFTRTTLCGSSGWYGEETLDVEAVHAMAPDANVLYAGAKNCFDDSFLDVFHRIVDGDGNAEDAPLATIVSNSWSDLETNETPANTAAYETVFQQGAVEGVGFYFSSGDDGDETISGIPATVDYPASDPLVTAVGGTTLGIDGNNGYQFETGWGTHRQTLTADETTWDPDSDEFFYGAGGGVSGIFDRPAYQVDAGVGASNKRVLPDVAAVGDPTTGMLVGETQTITKQSHGNHAVAEYSQYRIGGTSLSSPLIAGLHALVEQRLGSSLGFANPAIYALYSANPAALNDVVDPDVNTSLPTGNVRPDFNNGVDDSAGITYTLRTFGQDSSLRAVRGWDDVTGTGTPTLAYLQSLGS